MDTPPEWWVVYQMAAAMSTVPAAEKPLACLYAPFMLRKYGDH
jgi:hypothetical protein